MNITPYHHVMSAMEVPGIGQFHDLIIDDAVSRAEYALATGQDVQLVWQGYGQELQRMVAMKNWRSAAAFDILMRIQREVLANLELSPEKVYAGTS
jgi:hypothetical protein